MKTAYKIGIIGLSLLVVFITSYSFFFPKSLINQLLTYYNEISSFVIMLLTLVYVITTTKQLGTMEKQLTLMEKGTNLQVQPLPIPKISDIYLEKISVYSGPTDNFTSLNIRYRVHFTLQFENVGSGAALNITVFSTLKLPEHNISCTSSRDQLHCVSDKQSDNSIMSFMILDNDHSVLKSLCNQSLLLEFQIFYKNIFGIGFCEKVEYILYIPDEEDDKAKIWLRFLNEDIKMYEKDLKRYKALSQSVPEDAEEIFTYISKDLEERFKEDLILSAWVKPPSYEIEVLDDFNKAVEEVEHRHHIIFRLWQEYEKEAAASQE